MNAQSTPLVAIVGPTGAGKSKLALLLASAFAGEIVNYDSVQLYRGLDIGSAKIPPSERQSIPHHLLDVADPRDELTAGDFARLASQTLAQLTVRKTLPVFVGGTGFYLRSLLLGLSPAPPRNPDLRAALKAKRPAALHRFLRRRDPEAFLRIHPNDQQKLIRAVELLAFQGMPLPRNGLVGYSALKIGLCPDRTELHKRLNERSRLIFQQGLMEETRALLESGVPPEAKSLLSLGYRQAVRVLAGALSVEDAFREYQTKTRQYAKRQMTWFRAEPDVHWLDGFGDNQTVQDHALKLVREMLQCDTAANRSLSSNCSLSVPSHHNTNRPSNT